MRLKVFEGSEVSLPPITRGFTVSTMLRTRTFRVRIVALTLVLGAGVLAAVVAWSGADPDQLAHQALEDVRAERWDEAEATLDRLARLREPTASDWLLRAHIARARGQTDELLACLAQVSDTDPALPMARLMTGQYELRRHRARAAEAALLEALALDPNQIQARRELLYLYGVQLRKADLTAQFRALSEQAGLTYDDLFLWGLLTRNVVWDPELVEALERFLQADPTDLWSRLALAELLRRDGRMAEAEAMLAELPESNDEARALRVRLALERGATEQAERLLAEGSDDHLELIYLRGRLALTRRDLPTAERHLRRVCQADPSHRDAVFNLGTTLRLMGRAEDAEPLLQKARALDRLTQLATDAAESRNRQNPEFFRKIGAACEDAGLWHEARAWYQLAISQDPLDAEAQQALFRLDTARANTAHDPSEQQ